MAGIGFELKKLFAKKGLLLNMRANAYASVVIAGPMILGAVLLFGMKYLANLAGTAKHSQDVLIVIATYSVLFPLLITSTIVFVLTRYVADMLYEGKNERVLPSMYGGICICLAFGAAAWAIFLAVSQLPLQYCICSFILFCEAIVVWIQLSYTNAANDYRSVVYGFTLGILTSLLVGYVLIWLFHFETILSLLLAVCAAYGAMLITFTVVLHNYFPIGSGSAFRFLEWVEKYPSLILVGFLTMGGLFVHVLIMWGGPWGVQAIGLFYHAPTHDIPALLALFTTIVTTVNFVTSVEVRFYPKYRLYFSLLNGGGSLNDLTTSNHEMITVLKQELFYLAQIQMCVEIIAIALAGAILPRFGLGFTATMIGLFRVLAVGYGLYAVGNTMVLFLLYLSDYRDAMFAAMTLFVVNTVGTLITLALPQFYYGFGFLVASLGMFIVGWVRLAAYINRLDYNIFCKQPIFIQEKNGWLSRLARRLDANHG